MRGLLFAAIRLGYVPREGLVAKLDASRSGIPDTETLCRARPSSPAFRADPVQNAGQDFLRHPETVYSNKGHGSPLRSRELHPGRHPSKRELDYR